MSANLGGGLAFATFKFALYGFPNEVGAIFTVRAHGIDPVNSALREPGDHIFGPLFLASHAIPHMSY